VGQTAGAIMIREYVDCYRECSEWLADQLPWWAWVVGFWRACVELRQSASV